MNFSGLPFTAILAAYEEAVRDGRVVLVEAPAMEERLIVMSGELKVYVSKNRERCPERPHKRWPVRR